MRAMTRKLKAAVYGACHADALETVLHAHPDLREAVEFIPLEPCMTVTEPQMADFERVLPELDVLIHQPISSASRGDRFASAALLERMGAGATPISFPYFHFELYTPFITAPDPRLPPAPSDYVDYLLAALVVRGEDDPAVVERLQTFEGCDAHAVLMRGASMYELQFREERVLPGDRPLDVRVLERVRAAHAEERLCHTNNHPGPTVMGWIGDDVADRLRQVLGLPPVPPPAAARPDPLGDIDYPALPFVRSAFGLAFEDAPVVRLNGQTVGLARYVAQQRPYWEGVAPSTLRAIFEDTLPPRRWYGALLEML